MEEEEEKAQRLRLIEASRRLYGSNPFDRERQMRERETLEHPHVPHEDDSDRAGKRRRAGLPERERERGDTGENPFEGTYGKGR